MAQIETLAAEMGVSTADLAGFIACLKVWLDKGFSFDQAIEKHMAQMTRLVNHSVELAHSAAGRQVVVETFFA